MLCPRTASVAHRAAHPPACGRGDGQRAARGASHALGLPAAPVRGRDARDGPRRVAGPPLVHRGSARVAYRAPLSLPRLQRQSRGVVIASSRVRFAAHEGPGLRMAPLRRSRRPSAHWRSRRRTTGGWRRNWPPARGYAELQPCSALRSASPSPVLNARLKPVVTRRRVVARSITTRVRDTKVRIRHDVPPNSLQNCR
jgi:hypothetical protein